MSWSAWAALVAFLRRPLFGTVVVPRDAAVDPALFPDDAYPVFCAKCDYCLRGLPDGKCPECGTDFKRGRLLVSTYVTVWSGVQWRDSAAKKWSRRLMNAGFAVPCMACIGALLLGYLAGTNAQTAPSPATFDRWFRVVVALMAMMFTGPLFWLAALVIAIKAYPRGSWKRRRAILDAIKQAQKRTTDG